MWMEKAIMKKALLYVSAAVILGVGIMLFPLWTFFESYGEEGPIAFTDSTPYFKPMTASENWQEYTQSRAEEGAPTFGNYTAQTQPKSADASLQMITIGFIAAIVAFVIVRRRVHRDAYLPTYRLPVDR